LKPSYWKEKPYKLDNTTDNHDVNEEEGAVEREPVDLYASVKIKNLTKVRFFF
jgi:hypothetical protein